MTATTAEPGPPGGPTVDVTRPAPVVRGRGLGWVRRASALGALIVGAAHLALAATTRPPGSRRVLAVDYAVDAVIGARYVVLVLGLTLVLVARSLLHGKRTGWWVALVAAAVAVPGHHVKEADVVGAVLSAALAVGLVLGRRAFRVRSDPALARRGWQLLGVGVATVFAYGVGGLLALDGQFRGSRSVGQAVHDAVRLLFLLPVSTAEPATRHARWFVDSVRLAAVAVVLAALVRLVATTVLRSGRTAADEARVKAVLEKWATTSLAHFALLDDKAWFLSDDGDAVVAYKLVGRRNALALGDPIGSPEGRVAVAQAFVAFCEANGWVPAFHQVTEEGAAVLAAAGLTALKIGEEAVIPVQTWDLEAKTYKSLRSALRRVERAGYRLEEVPTPIPDATMDELRAVSDSWMHSSGHRERTFTLGRFDPDQLRATTVVAAVDADGRIGAFANVLPRYRSTEGNFDLMRRRPDTPNGIMDFLFVGLIHRFRDEGATGMNLGLAPLSGLDDTTVTGRALHLLYERGSGAFNFEGLRSFKDKWGPTWEPRYLCYRRPSELAGVAAAVVRAGELPDGRSVGARASAVARRFPFSLALAGVVLWFMAATAAAPRIHGQLLRHLGLSWADLTHLQWWRLATSPLVQTKPGFVWGNVALVALLVPLAEWRLGSRRSIATFALGDWLSTLPVLVAVRAAAVWGNDAAARVVVERDGGSSSGTWALAAALAWRLPGRRWRGGVAGALLGYQLVLVAWRHRLFDVQHAGAVVAGVLVSVAAEHPGWWRRIRWPRRGDRSTEAAAPSAPEAAPDPA